jgi:hypothetical protein
VLGVTESVNLKGLERSTKFLRRRVEQAAQEKERLRINEPKSILKIREKLSFSSLKYK